MSVQRAHQMDQGYAWLVAFSCFAINFIVAGLSRAAGVLYIALIELYGVSREAATTPFSIRFSIRNLSGPFVGLLGQRFGVRVVVLTGGILVGLGGILCVIAPNVFWITVFWGGVHGLGYGLCNIIHVLVINQYFDKYKASAMGFAFSGDCFGTFVFPVIIEILLENYGVNGTFLILGGISLNVIPAALLLRAPDWIETDERKETPKTLFDPERKEMPPCTYGILNKGFISESYPNLNAYTGSHEIQLTSYFSINNSVNSGGSNYLIDYKYKHEDRFIWNENLKNNVQLVLEDAPHLGSKATRSFTLPMKSGSPYSIETIYKNYHEKFCNDQSSFKTSDLQINEQSSDDRFRSGSKNSIPMNETLKSVAAEISSAGMSKKKTVGQDMPLTVGMNPEKALCIVDAKISCPVSVDVQRSALLQFLITNTRPVFILITVTMTVFVFMFIALITIIIDYASDIGITPNIAKYLVIGFSVADVVGRLGFGVILDKKWISMGHFAGLSTTLMGLSVLAMPLCANFYYLLSCMIFFGFVQGGHCIMYPILVEYYMDKREETVAMGSLNFYGGLLMLPLPMMIGFFRDTIGSYDGVFWTVGGLCTIAGVSWILEPCLWKWQRSMLKI